MNAHPYAELFPMMDNADLDNLATSIKENGLLDDIITLDGKILDGRNRYAACKLAGFKPRFKEFSGGDPLAWVVSHNLNRRHLTTSQRAMIAGKLANLGEGRPKTGPKDPVKSTAQAASELKVAEKSVKRAKEVLKTGVDTLKDMVEGGEVSVSAAAKVAKLPAKEQERIVAGGVDKVKEAAKEVKPETKEQPEKRQSTKYIPSDGMQIWVTAKSVMKRILPNDTERETALKAAIKYCQDRLDQGI